MTKKSDDSHHDTRASIADEHVKPLLRDMREIAESAAARVLENYFCSQPEFHLECVSCGFKLPPGVVWYPFCPKCPNPERLHIVTDEK